MKSKSLFDMYVVMNRQNNEMKQVRQVEQKNQHLAAINQALQAVTLSDSTDMWWWKHNLDGRFSVYSLRKLMVSQDTNGDGNMDFIWNGWTPLKVNCFMWRLMQNIIPLLDNLVDRGVVVDSQECKLCNRETESVDHVFFYCIYADSVWKWLANWSSFFNKIPENFKELTDTLHSIGKDKKKKSLMGNLSYTLIWWLWKERNERIYGKRRRNPMMLPDEIQINTFSWVKSRGRVNTLNWAEWSVNPGPMQPKTNTDFPIHNLFGQQEQKKFNNLGCLLCSRTRTRLRPRTTDRVRHQTLLSNASDNGPSPTSLANSRSVTFHHRPGPTQNHRPRTESDIKRTLSNARTTDRVRGLSPSLWSDAPSNSPLITSCDFELLIY
ncbi:hypothetical protein LXL04_036297 [Taraxacum kok-saghyz]